MYDRVSNKISSKTSSKISEKMTWQFPRGFAVSGLALTFGLTTTLVACSPATTRGNTEGQADGQALTADASTPSSASAVSGGEEATTSQDLRWGNRFGSAEVLAEFARAVAVPKYEQFSRDTDALSQAIAAFADNPNDTTLATARSAWAAVRSSWEQTEPFAFGPASALGFDGAMDSWPINQADIDTILASTAPVDGEAIADLGDTERGMHAIEYMLFGLDSRKAVADFSDRDRAYLQGLAQDLSRQSAGLLASWTQGVEGQPPFQAVLSRAGADGNAIYPSILAGGQELVIGLIDCLTEVGEEKLAAPFQAQDTQGLESRFSQLTLNDLKSNLRGVEAVYLGGVPNAADRASASLSDYVAQADAAIDAEVRQQLTAAKAALDAVPQPLEISLTDAAARDPIQAAVQAILAVRATLEEKVVPLI